MTEKIEKVDETPAPPPFRMVGDAAGPGCAGDVCELPAAAPASLDIEDLDP